MIHVLQNARKSTNLCEKLLSGTMTPPPIIPDWQVITPHNSIKSWQIASMKTADATLILIQMYQ